RVGAGGTVFLAEIGASMGSMSLIHWVIVLFVVMILFGAGKLGGLGKDLGEGIKNFKKGLADEDPNAKGGSSKAKVVQVDEDEEDRPAPKPKQLTAGGKKKKIIQVEVDDDDDEAEVARKVVAKKKAAVEEAEDESA